MTRIPLGALSSMSPSVVHGASRRRALLLPAGAAYEVPRLAGLTLTAGDAGAIRVLVDGQPVAALGPRGAVLRSISLAPEELMAARP